VNGWSATRFDGRAAAGEIARLSIDGDALSIASHNGVERVPIAQVRVPEPFEHAPRMLHLPGGATLEVPDPDRTLPQALAAAGVTTSWVVRLQKAWTVALACLVLVVALGAAFYVFGIPAAARYAVEAIPPEYEQRLGENLLELLTREYEPSALDAKRRAALEARFRDAASRIAPGANVRLEFRAGDRNAFALPGGIIVLLDDLVVFAKDDDAVLGVLGHELGHVVHRHSLRQLAQALGTAAFASLVWGDFSTVAANVPVILGVLRYGREFEEEADRFAIDFLARSGISPRPLHDFFVALTKEEPPARDDAGTRAQGTRRRASAEPPDFLSSHPNHRARIERLRAAIQAYEAGAATPR
jgi:Zn-dependent protease with chaperone function